MPRGPSTRERGEGASAPPADEALHRFWNSSPEALARELGCDLDGLSAEEARKRLRRFGPNGEPPEPPLRPIVAAAKRVLEPLVLVLVLAAAVSFGAGDRVGAGIIVAMVALSIGLETVQEQRAGRAAALLRRTVAVKAEVRRGGAYVFVDAHEIVPGDLIRVRAGDIVPADALVVSAEACTAGEAALTGEAYPVEKRPGAVASPNAAEAAGALFRGSTVQTGEALALVVATGVRTLFGQTALALGEAEAPSSLQHDLRTFGILVARATAVLAIAVMAANLAFGRPLLPSLLFSVAIAVGLTPELLPMVTTVTLSRGAIRLSKARAIVKRLASIHDLGAMTVLCTDKTGTLTSASISVSAVVGADGAPASEPLRLAAICAALGGDRGALDTALVAAAPKAQEGWTLTGQLPFDFHTRLGCVAATSGGRAVLIVKGAPEAVLAACATRRAGDAATALSDADRKSALDFAARQAMQGARTIAVATRPWADPGAPRPGDAAGLVLEGLVSFVDPPKPTAAAAIARLASAGIRVKVLSGDDPVVVARIAAEVGLAHARVLTGPETARLSDAALAVRATRTDLFARLTPDQKVRIVRALRARGEVVGFLGDGINDAPALKAAHVGLSVDDATGVARAAADVILLDPDLDVVADGVQEGRRTFADILKYLRMGASSNFGNMLSMAAASLFLPFLPMLATQVLLNNLLYDVSELGIPFDEVDPEQLRAPERWSMPRLIRFAAIMGPLSSAFDLLTFAGLLLVFRATPDAFRTGWFLESIATQILVIFLIRTRRRPWAARPHPLLAASSLGALATALAIPFSPLGPLFGFGRLPPLALAGLGVVVVVYLACAEALKGFAMAPARSLCRRSARRPPGPRRAAYSDRPARRASTAA